MLIKRKNHIKYKYGGVLKVNKRQEKIVLLLNDTKAWMTGKEISKLMQVSDRTIRSDVVISMRSIAIMNSQLLNPTYEVDIIFEMKLMLHCLQHKNL